MEHLRWHDCHEFDGRDGWRLTVRLLSHIQDRLLVLDDGRSKDIHDLRENLLSDTLAHKICKMLIDHEKHEPAYTLELNQWVLFACFIFVHDNVSHDFD